MINFNIEPGFQPKQQELLALILNSAYTWLGFGGSRGGSKSGAIRRIALWLCMRYPGIKVLIIRRTFDEVYENHVQKFFEEWPATRNWYSVTHKTLAIPCQGGGFSMIKFGYAEYSPNIESGDIMQFQGQEYAFIFVDEATHFVERELAFLKTCNRWPAWSEDRCKMILTMNPGNKGHAFIKRIFHDKAYHENEVPGNYAFIQAYGWDNIEWTRASLIKDGLTERDYYSWTDEERFKYFITRSDYGRTLNALPKALRIGHLLGRWDVFAGQYFDVFDPSKHVRRIGQMPYWVPRWIGIDWGFAHNSAVYWAAQDTKVRIYREFVANGLSPRALAQSIVDATPYDPMRNLNERSWIQSIHLSHDAFAERTSPETIAIQMGEVFAANGMPYPSKEDKDPVGGAALAYELMRSDELEIDPSCVKLIECIPMISRDETDSEQTVKFDGDDPYDGFRITLKGRLAERQAPIHEQIEKEIAEWKQEGRLTDPTSEMMWRKTLQYRVQRKIQARRFAYRWRDGSEQPSARVM